MTVIQQLRKQLKKKNASADYERGEALPSGLTAFWRLTAPSPVRAAFAVCLRSRRSLRLQPGRMGRRLRLDSTAASSKPSPYENPCHVFSLP
jgi:hypothetical protein